MLPAAVEGYLESLSERSSTGRSRHYCGQWAFTIIHFLHGPFEFGKDFIAKRSEGGRISSMPFQTKGGDVNLEVWRQARVQIDEMRANILAHPSFEAAYPRRVVFVSTGRFVGAAATSAQQYRDHLERLGEAGFEHWDTDRLVELICALPDVGFPAFAQGALLVALGEIDGQSTGSRPGPRDLLAGHGSCRRAPAKVCGAPRSRRRLSRIAYGGRIDATLRLM